jgi:hypothetical protein
MSSTMVTVSAAFLPTPESFFNSFFRHHSTTINIRGDSYRLKERRKAGLIPLPDQQQVELPTSANSRGKRSNV